MGDAVGFDEVPVTFAARPVLLYGGLFVLGNPRPDDRAAGKIQGLVVLEPRRAQVMNAGTEVHNVRVILLRRVPFRGIGKQVESAVNSAIELDGQISGRGKFECDLRFRDHRRDAVRSGKNFHGGHGSGRGDCYSDLSGEIETTERS